MNDQEAYYELAYYTLAHPSPEFIHQYVVDAFTAQTANEQTKSIAINFALVGLYLHIEKHYTGREVQQAHVRLSNIKKDYKKVELPMNRGAITIHDVLVVEPGINKDQIIELWCQSVWKAFESVQQDIVELSSLLEN